MALIQTNNPNIQNLDIQIIPDIIESPESPIEPYPVFIETRPKPRSKPIQKLNNKMTLFIDLINPMTTSEQKYKNKLILNKIIKLFMDNSNDILADAVDSVLNIANSNDIIFYNDKIRSLICTIAFLNNLKHVVEMKPAKFVNLLGVSDMICKLLDNLDYADGDITDYRELSLVINTCMKTKKIKTRYTELELYLYSFIKPLVLETLNCFN